MVDAAAKEFLKYAETNNLVGPTATLDAWDRYAWSLPGKTQASQDFLSNGEYNPTAAAQYRASGDSFN